VKRNIVLLALLAAGALAVVGGVASAAPSCTLDTPTLECYGQTATSITLRVCAGASGAPAGISIQWKTYSDYLANGWDAGDTYSAISLSGNCQQGTSNWSLGPGQCRLITFNASTVDYENQVGCGASGDQYDLTCDTQYIFRVFAHNETGPGGCKASDKSDPGTVCSTAPCPVEGECTLTWGYWKTHGPAGCNPPGHENKWPLDSFTIGGHTLSDAEVCDILQTPPKACAKGGSDNSGSNAVVNLEHQLIAAMLNKAAGAVVCGYADQAIAQANALLADNWDKCIGASTITGQQMLAVQGVLAAYNSDQCSCTVPNLAAPATLEAPTDIQKKTWGELKIIYR
jgi:hypothetical protein